MSGEGGGDGGEWVATVALDDIDPDYPVMATVGGTEVAICRSDDEAFAVGNICSHAFARLSDGHVEDGQVFCPLHNGSFDVRTGAAVAAPCYEPVLSYPAKVENGTVFVWSLPRPISS